MNKRHHLEEQEKICFCQTNKEIQSDAIHLIYYKETWKRITNINSNCKRKSNHRKGLKNNSICILLVKETICEKSNRIIVFAKSKQCSNIKINPFDRKGQQYEINCPATNKFLFGTDNASRLIQKEEIFRTFVINAGYQRFIWSFTDLILHIL